MKQPLSHTFRQLGYSDPILTSIQIKVVNTFCMKLWLNTYSSYSWNVTWIIY